MGHNSGLNINFFTYLSIRASEKDIYLSELQLHLSKIFATL
jgi:hypothetical protein